MRKYPISVIILLFFVKIVFGQIGQPFIKNFMPEQYRGSGQIWAIAQSDDGIMYFAGNNGIYIYDGQRWDLYDFGGKSNYVVRSLGVMGDTIFYGSVGDFGFLLPSGTGFEQVSLTQKLDSALKQSFSDVWGLQVYGKNVVFTTDTIVFVYNSATDSVFVLSHDKSGYTFVSLVNGKFFYATTGRIYRYNPLSQKLDKFDMPGSRVWHFLPFHGDTLLLVSGRNIMLYDFQKQRIVRNKQLEQVKAQILKQIIYSVRYLPQVDAYAFGTINSGIYFLNKHGQILKHIDKSKGIVSQTIQYLFSDRQGNLWAGTSSGISLLNISLPYEIFDERNGLEGVPYSALVLDTSIFLGTNVDLFRYNWKIDKFMPVHTHDGSQVQQIFVIDTVHFSDGTKQVIIAANGGIFRLTEQGFLEQISPIGNYDFIYSSAFPDTLYVVDDYKLYKIVYSDGKFSKPQLRYTFKDFYYLRAIDKTKLWFSGMMEEKLGYLDLITNDFKLIDISNLEINGAAMTLDSVLLFATNRGFYRYFYKTDTFLPAKNVLNKFFAGKKVSGFEQIDKNMYLVLRSDEVESYLYLVRDGQKPTIDSSIFQIVHRVESATYHKNSIWFITSNAFLKFRLDSQFDTKPAFKPLIRKIIIDPDSVLFYGASDGHDLNFELPFKYNSITVYYALPSFYEEGKVEFSYYLEGGKQKNWSDWTTDIKKELSNLPEGHYTFHLRARNEFKQQTAQLSFSFRILPPWYRTFWAYTGYLILLLLFVYLIVKLNERRLKRENERLEQLVKIRTAEIEQQKEEIKAQAENLREVNQLLVEKNEEIRQILESLRQANKKISDQHEHIKASIEYARKIQKAIISRQNLFEYYFPEYFIFYKPKETVSGDFYWIDKQGRRLFVAVADCTGHGVPGAFMSMLSYALLSQIVAKNQNSTRLILEQLRQEIIKILVPSTASNNAIIHRDGLDIALIAIDFEQRILEFSGAYNPLIIIRNGQIIELKPVKASIGYSRKLKPFQSQFFKLQEGDTIYMFTDGFMDQYGGDRNTKFYRHNFYKLLGEISHFSLERQGQILAEVFEQWKDGHFQIDDVTVIGFKVSFKKWTKDKE